MAWAPTASVAVLKEAVVKPPEVLTLTGLPALLPSIWNWTVPVGVPVPGAVTLMVAVNVNDRPNSDGSVDDVSAVLVLALLTAWPPVSVALLLAKLPSPL